LSPGRPTRRLIQANGRSRATQKRDDFAATGLARESKPMSVSCYLDVVGVSYRPGRRRPREASAASIRTGTKVQSATADRKKAKDSQNDQEASAVSQPGLHGCLSAKSLARGLTFETLSVGSSLIT
jgi:hypothetical protein